MKMSCCHLRLEPVAVCLLALAMLSGQGGAQTTYYGKEIGRFPTGQAGLDGTVYAVDANRLQIVGFSFDGSGTAQFRAGSTASPSGVEGVQVPDEQGRTTPLGVYSNGKLVIALPAGTTVDNIKWFAVWSQNSNLGHVTIPDNFVYPSPRRIGQFTRYAHGVRSGEVTILNAKSFRIESLHYDGAGPEGFFWAGTGSSPSRFGFKVPDHRGSFDQRAPRYTGQTIEIMLPGDVTVYDIRWLSLWCIAFTQNFGHVTIPAPADLNVPPLVEDVVIPPRALDNCVELSRDMQVSWTLTGDSLEVELAGRVEDGDYMAFGPSGCDGRTCMVGSDVTVAWFDSDVPRAVDYTLRAYSQCSGTSGVCPDDRVSGTDDNVNITGRQNNGITRIRYSRPINTGDATNDKVIDPSQNMYISWAIGPINPSGVAAKHHTRVQEPGVQITFGRNAADECEAISSEALPPVTPWPTRYIKGDEVTEFTIRIGPTGGRRGYQAITGQPSWGIAWFVNDLLIPELELKRGYNYTFIVEGGDNSSIPAQYHPFYITDDPKGGYVQKTDAEKERVRVFAGVSETGMPTAAGRYCEYTTPNGDTSETSDTFEAYFNTLQLECQPGQAARFTWTPDQNTPNLVYYHCFTHQFLGWKIRVVDEFTSGAVGVHASTLAVVGSLVVGALSVLLSRA